MGLINEKIKIKWPSTNKQHYIDLGYNFTKVGDIFEVDVNDLSRGACVLVRVQCDYCESIVEMPWKAYLKLKGNTYCCPECLQHKKKTRDKDGNLIFVEIPYRNKEWLYNEYIIKGRDATDISKECGVNIRTLREWIHAFHLTDIKGLNLEDKISRDELYDMYCLKHMTTEEIGDLYSTTGNTIASLLRKYNIPIPTRSELNRVYYNQKGGREKFKEYGQRLENRIATSCRMRGIPIDDFDGFVSDRNALLRNCSDYREWRRSVFKRDNYTCQCCDKRSGKLNAHHILNWSDNVDLRYDIDNGITLCEECHLIKYPNSFHSIYGEKNNTREQLDEYIKNRKEKIKVA